MAYENLHTLIVMVHDLPGGDKSDHGDLFGLLEMHLTADGLHTLRFDFRGCGESPGKPELASLGSASRDLEAVLNWGRETGYRQFLIIGEGLGAAIAFAHMGESVTAAILLWPWLDPKQIAREKFNPGQWLDMENPPATVEIGGRSVGTRLLLEASKTNLRPFMKKVRVPVTILIGETDEIVSLDQIDVARTYIPSKRLEINTYQGGHYGLPDASHRRNLLAQVRDFTRKHA